MNDPMIIAAAIVLVIASMGGVIVQVINARSAADERREAKNSRIKLEKEAEISNIKNDRIIEQGVAIHTLTNSNLSTVTAALATATSKIEGLERLISSMDKIKEVPAENVLEDIKENTGDTVKAVENLKK